MVEESQSIYNKNYNSVKVTRFSQFDQTLEESQCYADNKNQDKILMIYTRGNNQYSRIVYPFQDRLPKKLRTYIWCDHNLYLYNIDKQSDELKLIYAGRENLMKENIEGSSENLIVIVDHKDIAHIQNGTAFSINPLTHEINMNRLSVEDYEWIQSAIEELQKSISK